MIKTILLIVLGLFFILNGINHLINTQIYKEYSEKKGLMSPKLMVRLSGIALILGGISVATKFLLIYGIIGLCTFLIIASFTIHQFWKENTSQAKLMESMHFAKNIAIFTELLYIANS